MIFNRCFTGESNRVIARQQRELLKQSNSFAYNGKLVDIVSQFKYLGIIFHEDVMCTYHRVNNIIQCKLYDAAIKFRVSQGRKCLATWLRRCNTWMLNTDLMLTLFKTGAMPALEYGVGMWGVGSVRNDVWREVESFWLSVSRYILHAPIRTPISAIIGDLGWMPFNVRAGQQAVSFFTRISKMDDTCLVRKAMYVQRGLLGAKCPCWLANFKIMLGSLKDDYLNHVWNDYYYI